MPVDWSIEEVEATVADYFDMLSAELRGEAYSKAEHRRRLQPLLNGRSEPAIERKHGNISAVLIELGLPYIQGYKPFSNYQRLLFEAVVARLDASSEIEALVATDVSTDVSIPSVDDILSSLVAPPAARGRVDRARENPLAPFSTLRKPRVDYIRRESMNAALGAAGEDYVVNFERARLIAAHQERLANKIEHISKTRGDGAGYDVLSYETSGRERLIEVKTTRYGAQTPFFVTRNEVAVSEQEAERYHLYRVFAFRRAPRLFGLAGSLSRNFSLSPTQYLARIG